MNNTIWDKSIDEMLKEKKIFLIPNKIFQKKLSLKAIGIYARMLFSQNKLDCTFTVNNLITESDARSSIESGIKELVNEGIISVLNLSPEECKKKSIETVGTKICEWCGKNSIVLQKHHYPISRKNGGIEVVNICPNCHYAYHHFDGESSTYEISEDYICSEVTKDER